MRRKLARVRFISPQSRASNHMVRPSPRSGAPTMWSNRAAIKPAARSSWVKSQGARPNVAGANNATPLIPGPRRIAHSPNEKAALQLHTYRLERRARVSALRPCSQGIPRLAGEDVAPRSRTPVQSPTLLRFRVIVAISASRNNRKRIETDAWPCAPHPHAGRPGQIAVLSVNRPMPHC